MLKDRPIYCTAYSLAYICSVNEQQHAMNASITSITFKRPAAHVNVYGVVLSNGRTLDAFGATEEAAIAQVTARLVAEAHPEEVEAERTKSVVTASDIMHMGQGIWSAEFNNAMAEIAAKSTGIAVDISAKFKKYHTISIAQAQVLARVATANNITL